MFVDVRMGGPNRWGGCGDVMGLGGALVESMTFDQRVAGSNPSIVATWCPWASPSLVVVCSASAWKLRHSAVSIVVVGSASERLRKSL